MINHATTTQPETCMRSTETYVNNLGKKFAFATKMQSSKIPSCLYQRNLLPLEESKLLQDS